MNIKIIIDKPDWSAVNHDKKVLMVEFPNCISNKTMKPFRWLPRYDELLTLKKQLDNVELEWEKYKEESKEYNEKRRSNTNNRASN